MIKFNLYNVTNGETRASVNYSVGARTDKRECINIYANDYSRDLGKIFAAEYKNDTDSMVDHFDKGSVVLFADHPLYPAALAMAQRKETANAKRLEKRRAKWAV